MMLTFNPPLPSNSLNILAFQHRFNTEIMVLLHLAYTFGIHLYSIVLTICIHDQFIAYLCFFDSFLLACSYMYIFSYVVLDTAVTKMQLSGGISRLV